ncbi:Inositol oxygenase 1 [Sarracenia purpurea var. burkii]
MATAGSVQTAVKKIQPDSNAFGYTFRDYGKESEGRAGVEQFYKTNHINQTYEFAKKKKEEYGKPNRAEMSIWECCELLSNHGTHRGSSTPSWEI